jgi:hypothetical protein
MWHNLLWIGGIWLVALVFAWLICHWRGYKTTAWAFAISAFCLGLLVGTVLAANAAWIGLVIALWTKRAISAIPKAFISHNDVREYT